MKNHDLLKVVASKLNGLQYGMVFSYELIAFCKENGIVICSGQSDDLMELDGAIYDEYGCWDGGTISIDENGNEADSNSYYPITAVWGKDNISWQYEFEPKHEVFTIYEDADIYCKGIVFFVDDLKRKQESDCPICSIKRGEAFDIRPECDMEEISVYAKRYEKSGNLIICVEHIDGSFEEYRPKYCPECGRKLHD